MILDNCQYFQRYTTILSKFQHTLNMFEANHCNALTPDILTDIYQYLHKLFSVHELYGPKIVIFHVIKLFIYYNFYFKYLLDLSKFIKT